ncbi:CT214 family putative inclusion membrane protein [Chlamydia sp. 17-3921]|uniref:CT214 family putative inclusion membrane protein n=2 Tax=Chlamydia sp. 17-3921 TaxID=2675798 RepID=UPI001918B7AF|nr:hypothetical protein [Chlamydia sp. 17-3921]
MSRDVIITTIFLSIIALLSILAVILVSCQAIVFSEAVIYFLPAIVVSCFLGILLIFVLNMGKSSVPQLRPIDEITFSRKERKFLEYILNLSLRQDEQPPQPISAHTDFLQIYIETSCYRENTPFLKNIENRLKILEEHISSLMVEIFQAISECQKKSGIILGILDEIKNLFIPKFLSRRSKYSLCKCLNDLAEILIKHPCADFIILILKNKDLMQVLANQLISLSPSDNSQNGVYRKTLDFLNLWFYGWFRETETIQQIEDYDSSLLTLEIRHYLNSGNFVELVFSFQTEEVKEQIKTLFDLNTQAIIPAIDHAQYSTGMNSIEYMQNDLRLRAFMDSLNLHFAFCLNLRDPTDRMFPWSIARHYKELIGLYDFYFKEHQIITKNPFLLLEVFQGNTKYQKFIRGLLKKAMPIKLWEVLFLPIISAMFRVGIAKKKELEVLSTHLGINLESLIEAIKMGEILTFLLPHVFSEELP